MTDRDTIIATYNTREEAAGGLPCCDVRRVVEETAEALSLPFSAVHEVLVDHWAGAVN